MRFSLLLMSSFSVGVTLAITFRASFILLQIHNFPLCFHQNLGLQRSNIQRFVLSSAPPSVSTVSPQPWFTYSTHLFSRPCSFAPAAKPGLDQNRTSPLAQSFFGWTPNDAIHICCLPWMDWKSFFMLWWFWYKMCHTIFCFLNLSVNNVNVCMGQLPLTPECNHFSFAFLMIFELKTALQYCVWKILALYHCFWLYTLVLATVSFPTSRIVYLHIYSTIFVSSASIKFILSKPRHHASIPIISNPFKCLKYFVERFNRRSWRQSLLCILSVLLLYLNYLFSDSIFPNKYHTTTAIYP